MRATKRFLWMFAVQLLLVAACVRAEVTHIPWLVLTSGLVSLVVSFVGYIVVLYPVPLGFSSSGPARILVLTLLSFFFTLFGSLFWFLILAIAGMPIRG